MLDFGGWDMPIHYGSQINEHNSVRHSLGVFDVTHITVLEVMAKKSNDLDAYSPLLIPKCHLIEPTETESKETIDEFVPAMASILKEVQRRPDVVTSAPHTLPVKRLDDLKSARELDLTLTD